MTSLLSALVIAGIVAGPAKKPDLLAPTPPMGWNSWNKFACNVSEQLIRETADALVASGMKAAGYEYVTIDDCWQGERDEQGFIKPDAKRFPSGMNYVHGDLWTKQKLGTTKDVLNAEVPSHDVLMVRLEKLRK
jgi:alpha-galactosidase